MNPPVEPPIRVESQRFVLRTLCAEDATQRYADWLNDPEVNRFLEVRHAPQSLDSVRRFIASHDNRRKFLIGIFLKDAELHIGNFRLQLDPPHRTATLGVIIGDREHWGQGVVLEARARLLDFIFEALPVEKVSGGCYQTNVHAVFNYQRQGWTPDGIRRADRIDGDRRVDVVHFAMFKANWQERHA